MNPRITTLLALLPLSVAARAGQTCHTLAQPAQLTNWSHPFVLPKHDPAIGVLQSVTVTLRSTLDGAMALENFGPTPATYTARLAILASLRRPDSSSILDVEPQVDSSVHLAAYDGTLDFGGPSGVWFQNLHSSRELHVVLDSPADLALFTAMSSGETIALSAHASGTSVAMGPGSIPTLFMSTAAVDVSVCYGFREACQPVSIAPMPANWQRFQAFAKHDPTLGPLTGVRLRTTVTVSGTTSLECLDPVGSNADLQHSADLVLRRPDASLITIASVQQQFLARLGPFDGTIDFGGTSGAMHMGTASSSIEIGLTSPADLALFTAASPGEMISLDTSAQGTSTASGTGNITALFNRTVGADIELCYDFASLVTPICFGDGSGAACPCGNASAPGAGQGCLNSFGLGGELRATGFADLGSDTLVLSASNLAASAPALFFQGTSAISAPFGDGLRCAGGTMMRLGIVAATAGTATFPPSGSTVSQAGAAMPGSTLVYQAWYRNAAPFCTSSAFNLTNALLVAW